MEEPELLSPVGDFECLKAAVQNGAKAVYLGASSFNARAKATNFDTENLKKAIKYAKARNVKVHLTLNTLIKNNEFLDAVNLAIESYNLGVDAIIVQDFGLAKFLLENYPEIPLHASTQMTVHNLTGVNQLASLGFSRVVLSRELSLDEIKYIKNNTNTELEVFIHGALCISYSGQCLLSSMIGGRSGNRGLCAQPCRLPFELIEKDINNQKEILLDKGYLLSPRDNCAIEFLPELIKYGVNSFKIEGRMKTPTYVGTVTRIYRKYIDLVLKNINLDNELLRKMIRENLEIKNITTGLSDREELIQVFNRGGFSTGHLRKDENKELIFREKPNNMGIYLGTITHINENKGHLKLKLENTLSIGDKVSINNESYTVSELMIDNQNYDSLEKNKIVKIGRMKGKISVGNKVYRIETAKLNKFIAPSFKEEKNLKKVYIFGEICIKKNERISLKVWSDEGFYKGIEIIKFSENTPDEALNNPINKEKVIKQISKTGTTEFEFKNIEITLDDGLFVQMSALNDLRRLALEELENAVITKNSHNLLPIKNLDVLEENREDVEKNENSKIINKKQISLLLNIINTEYDYSKLENINKIYIPLKYFFNINYQKQIEKMLSKFEGYIYMPSVLRNEKIEKLDLDNIVSKFDVKGFVISHISQIENVKKYNLELIGNFTLNIYNSFSVKFLNDLGISQITTSIELDKFETNNVLKLKNIKSEVIVYGKIPVMTNNYCYLGKSNKCYEKCKQKCKTNNIYYLKDRMNFNFRIIPDNTSTITTIYNSKTLSVKYEDLNSDSVRIDILDENLEEIQNVINTIYLNKRFEGKAYTNLNY